MNEYGVEDAIATYLVNVKHRNQTPNASQWTISSESEIASFRLAERSGWLLGAVGFGLHVVNTVAEEIGISKGRVAFISKFVSSAEPVTWHGYPVLSTDGILPALVGRDWIRSGYLRPAVVRKALRGQPCSL